MRAVIEDFEQRVEEVRGYLRLLKAIEWPGSEVRAASKPSHRNIPVEDEWRKVAKATGYLLIYNIVESAIRSAFAYVYDVIATEGCTLRSIDTLIRDLWLDAEHKRLSRESATPESYRRKAAEMVQAALTDQVIKLDVALLLAGGGNLDARRIRELCELHGVPHRTHPSARGGAELQNVKDQRNALAHGHRSFSECGRNVTIDDLGRITKEAEIFVRGILRNIERYMKRRRYATGAPASAAAGS